MSDWSDRVAPIRGASSGILEARNLADLIVMDGNPLEDLSALEEIEEGLQADGFPEEAHAAVAYRVTDGEITLVRMFM